MIDPQRIRSDLAAVIAAVSRKHRDGGTQALERFRDVDSERRALVGALDQLKARRNSLARQVGERKRKGDSDAELMAEAAALADQIRAQDRRLKELDEELEALGLEIPNLPDPDVPEGRESAANVVVREWSPPAGLPDKALPYWDIIHDLGIVDLKKGARLSGSGFPVFLGAGARLERALVEYFLTIHTARGYIEVDLPLLVNRETALGAAALPDKEGQMYYTQDGHYLLPTAETALANLHGGETIREQFLPLRYTAYTPCFRREAGSYGKDARGLIRVHQFHKVELFEFCRPEDSPAALERLVGEVEGLLQALGLCYRIVLLCAGDLTFASAKTYDFEVWSPGQGEWREVSSVSNVRDFQARRTGTRYQPAAGGKAQFVHMLNGSGLALSRLVPALLETHRQPDGSVRLPVAIRPWMGGREAIVRP